MNKKLRKVLTVLLAAVFLGGLGTVVYKAVDYRRAEKTYSNAQQIAFAPPAAATPEIMPADTQPVEEDTSATPTEPEEQIPLDEYAQYLLDIQLAALQEVNADVMGWIYIPDSPISYPLIKANDRDTYLHTAWDGTKNTAGSIFLEQENSKRLTDFNSIIYGHQMVDGSMFASVIHYRYPDYAASHPYIYIVTADSIYRYRVFAAYEANLKSYTYQVQFQNDKERERALSAYLRECFGDAQPPTAQDRILTLSTCTGRGYDTRWVVQGALDVQWKK